MPVSTYNICCCGENRKDAVIIFEKKKKRAVLYLELKKKTQVITNNLWDLFVQGPNSSLVLVGHRQSYDLKSQPVQKHKCVHNMTSCKMKDT